MQIRFEADWRERDKMGMFDEIYKNIEKVLDRITDDQKKNIIIYPFEESGYMVKRILNQEFHIHEKGILDDTLADISPNHFLGFECLNGLICGGVFSWSLQ